MQTVSDLLYLFGSLLLFTGLVAALYFWIPTLRVAVQAAPAADEGPRSAEEWGRLADLHEGYAPGHARRVADLALALADAVGLDPADRLPLEQAALMHDVGELDPALAALLNRPGPLQQAELFQLWTHPARGAATALAATGSPVVAQWVRWHHERWDGLGYPDGLAGTAIPLPVRILRLADTVDAMGHPRPYRPAHSPAQIAAEIDRLAGISYDPELARLFVDYVWPQRNGPGAPNAPEA